MNFKGFSVLVVISTSRVRASYGVMSNTLKPLTNAHTVRGRPTPNDDDERAFRKGSFCELVANISNVAFKFSQVQKRSLHTKYVRTVTSNHRGTLTNLTRNFDAGKSRLIFDNQHNGTQDNNDNKKLKKNKNTVTLDEREGAYRSEDASNSFTFMIIMIIIPYIFTMYLVNHHLYQFLSVLH